LEAETLGNSDVEQLRYATRRGWIVLPFDDTLSLVSDSRSTEHAGIVYARQHGRDGGDIVRSNDAALDRHADRDLAGEVLFACGRPTLNRWATLGLVTRSGLPSFTLLAQIPRSMS
jgi:hypothetical protein